MKTSTLEEIGAGSLEARAAVERLGWLTAVKFCRWLSEREGIPESEMCFPPIPQIQPEMKLTADLLARTGYRLPTDAEWEYSARAGTSTPRYFGSSSRLASFYAWSMENAPRGTRPCGLLKPNDLGLFDVLGNSDEWTQNGYEWSKEYPSQKENIEDIGDLKGKVHIRRGGNHLKLADQVNIQDRHPTADFPDSGFRVARTIKRRVPEANHRRSSQFHSASIPSIDDFPRVR